MKSEEDFYKLLELEEEKSIKREYETAKKEIEELLSQLSYIDETKDIPTQFDGAKYLYEQSELVLNNYCKNTNLDPNEEPPDGCYVDEYTDIDRIYENWYDKLCEQSNMQYYLELDKSLNPIWDFYYSLLTQVKDYDKKKLFWEKVEQFKKQNTTKKSSTITDNINNFINRLNCTNINGLITEMQNTAKGQNGVYVASIIIALLELKIIKPIESRGRKALYKEVEAILRHKLSTNQNLNRVFNDYENNILDVKRRDEINDIKLRFNMYVKT